MYCIYIYVIEEDIIRRIFYILYMYLTPWATNDIEVIVMANYKYQWFLYFLPELFHKTRSIARNTWQKKSIELYIQFWFLNFESSPSFSGNQPAHSFVYIVIPFYYLIQCRKVSYTSWNKSYEIDNFIV